MTDLVLPFGAIGSRDVGRVGGKNASLGELWNALAPAGVRVLDGFATTATFFRSLLDVGGLREKLSALLGGLDVQDVGELSRRGEECRRAVLATPLPPPLERAVVEAHAALVARLGRDPELAVRSSATAEDLPTASFAGQHDTYLNVRGADGLLRAVHACLASLFTDRAISYRARNGFDHLQVALSVGVMPMVRSDLASAGVIFTLDPDSGFRDVVLVTSSWGLGESVVQGIVSPDEWLVFKTTLADRAARPIVGRTLGAKETRLVYGDSTRATRGEAVPERDRRRFSLTDDEVLTLARWACLIEAHYSKGAAEKKPYDIEWAKDGVTGELVIVQARPETVHSRKERLAAQEVYTLDARPGPPLVTGIAVGERMGHGPVRVVRDARALATVRPGDVIVAEMTNPDWEPVMKRAAAIVTDHGGRTAHAAIVSRELGLPCIVGTGRATERLRDGQVVTVSCAEGPEGRVYEGKLAFTIQRIETSSLARPVTDVMVNVADPAKAFVHAALPAAGVGLARIEFVITNQIGAHPMALARHPKLQDTTAKHEIDALIGDEDAREYFVRRLAEGVGRIAAAFHPRPVIVRTSDFKTNEYARLLGGREFEPEEENPMIGFRGASRYYDTRYRDGFALECRALLRVRRDMRLGNVKVMIPFCRTVEEGRKVLAVMAENGLRQGEDGLEVYAMCELPSNVLCAEEFLEVFDGFSIGSNDLTQLTLGLDRDSGTVAHLFDERDPAVKRLIARAIEVAKLARKKIGICGQAPSDHPEFARWLVERGIDSISLNPDAVVKTIALLAPGPRPRPVAAGAR